MRRNPASGFTLIEILVVVAIIGVLLVILLPRIVGVSDQAYVTACKKILQDQFMEIEQYRQRFNRYPTASGVKFLGELWKKGQIDLLQKQYGESFGQRAVFEALNDYDNLSSEYVSYACRNMKEYKIDFSKPASQLLVSDDDEDGPNHRFKINCLYLNGSVDDVDITEFPNEIFVLGPESPLEKFRVLTNN
jgi:prepilin-type N-terminal cleavage/methylation domain-containing protein